jgi:hypothetical protein
MLRRLEENRVDQITNDLKKITSGSAQNHRGHEAVDRMIIQTSCILYHSARLPVSNG